MNPHEDKPADVLAPLGDFLRALNRGRRERAAEKQLAALSNSALRDIGISRAEISLVLKNLAARRVD